MKKTKGIYKKNVLAYMQKNIYTPIPQKKYVHIKVCVRSIYAVLDVVYRYNYDTMSFLNTYIVTRIHILNIGKNSMTYYS